MIFSVKTDILRAKCTEEEEVVLVLPISESQSLKSVLVLQLQIYIFYVQLAPIGGILGLPKVSFSYIAERSSLLLRQYEF